MELIAQQIGYDLWRERSWQGWVKLRVENMRHHDHRHDALVDDRAVGNKVNGLQLGKAAIHVGERKMRVDAGAA